MATLVIPAWIARYCNLLPGNFWCKYKQQLLVQGLISLFKKIKSTIYEICLVISNQNFYSLAEKYSPLQIYHVLYYKCTQTKTRPRKSWKCSTRIIPGIPSWTNGQTGSLKKHENWKTDYLVTFKMDILETIKDSSVKPNMWKIIAILLEFYWAL